MKLQLETEVVEAFYDKVRVADPSYRVDFRGDITAQVDAAEYCLVETIKVADPSVESPTAAPGTRR